MMPKSTADQIARRVDEQIAGMHVGMKEAVADGMPQKDSGSDDRASARRSSPAAPERRRDPTSGVPSIHSLVSTRRAVRGHSTCGNAEARIFGDVARPSPAIAAASMRRSISISTDCASVADRIDRPQAPRCGAAAARPAAPRRRSFEIAWRNAARSPGRRIFTATRGRRRRASRDAPGRSRRPPPADRIPRTAPRLGAETAPSIIGPRLVHAERRQAVLQAAQIRRRAPRRRYRAASPGTARA